MERLKNIIKSYIKEGSTTNSGGASFTTGEGENYATPAALKSKTNSKGTKNIYYYKLGFKPVPNIKPKSYDKKKLWEEDEPDVKKFHKDRIDEFNQISNIMRQLAPLISNAKNETVEFYAANPGSFDIYKPSTMVLTYLTKALDLLKQKQ
jgi:hypothetical protein